MTFALIASALVAVFGASWFAFCCSVLRDVEDERIDLARAAHPCTQTLTRYQG